MATGIDALILGIIIGTLLAIVYALRVLVLMERRLARVDAHIETLVKTILEEEEQILAEEQKIEDMLNEQE